MVREQVKEEFYNRYIEKKVRPLVLFFYNHVMYTFDAFRGVDGIKKPSISFYSRVEIIYLHTRYRVSQKRRPFPKIQKYL